MRTIVSGLILGVALAIAGCTPAEQQRTESQAAATGDTVEANAREASQGLQQSAQTVGEDVTQGAKKAGAEIRELTSDPEVKQAAGEVGAAAKRLGAAVTGAARDTGNNVEAAGERTSTTVTTTTTTRKAE